jgi:hypothetical protein
VKRYAPLAMFIGLFVLGIIGCAYYIIRADRDCPVEAEAERSPDLGQVYRENSKRRASNHPNYPSHQNETGTKPWLVLLTVVQAAAEQSESNAHSQSKKTKHPRWFTNFFCEAKVADVALVLFTYGLMLITGYLVWATIGLRKASHEIFVATDRPWVGPRTVGAEQIAPNQFITAWVVIENSGRSPAREMRVHFRGDILSAGVMPPKPDVSQRPSKALFSRIPDWYHPFHQHRLSQADFDGIVAGNRVAWIIGRVEYRDTRNDPHFTDVCTRWDQPLGRFVPHDTGNDAN